MTDPTRPRTRLALLATLALLLLVGSAAANEGTDGDPDEATPLPDGDPEEIFQTTSDDDMGPCAPAELSAEPLGVVVHLQWSDVANASAYHVYRAKADGEMHLAIVTNGTTNETIDTQVEGGVVYTYAVTAVVDGNETMPCGFVEVLVSAEPCHPGLSVIAQEGPQNRLTWTMVSVAEGYNLYRAEGDGDLELLAEVDASTGGFVDTDVEAGTTYTYEVRAVIDGEERPACAAVEVTTIPAFPTALVGGLAALAGVGAYVVLRRRR